MSNSTQSTISGRATARDCKTPRKVLKRATRRQHRGVEQILEARFFEGDEFTRNDYVDFLAAHFRLYAPLESVLVPEITGHLDGYQYQSRSKKLSIDLDFLDQSLESRLESKKLRPDIRLDAPEDVLGCLYVLEGAQFGNVIIRRRIEGALGSGVICPDGYFGRTPKQVRENWGRFKELLNATVSSRSMLSASIEAAKATFHYFSRGLG